MTTNDKARTGNGVAPEPATTAAATTVPDGRPRVVVLSLNYRPGERVVNYTRALSDAGVQVDLVVPDDRSAAEVELDPRIRVHPILPREGALPVRRMEKAIVYRLPGGTLAVARRLAQRGRLAPVDSLLKVAERGHRRVAGAVHNRVFMPFYRNARPWLLARRAQRTLTGLEVSGADRIVAADVSAVPLGWRLARRHPQIRATTVLDRQVPGGKPPAAPPA